MAYISVIYCIIAAMVFMQFETGTMVFEDRESGKRLKRKLNMLKVFYSLFWIVIPFVWILEAVKEEQERFDVYKKESKENENLKLGMWKHLGAKICVNKY